MLAARTERPLTPECTQARFALGFPRGTNLGDQPRELRRRHPRQLADLPIGEQRRTTDRSSSHDHIIAPPVNYSETTLVRCRAMTRGSEAGLTAHQADAHGDMRRRLIVSVVFIAVTIVFLRPTPDNLTHTLTNLGDPSIYAWSLSWSSHVLASHPTTVFQAPIFWPNPDTLAYTDSLLLLSLPFALVRALGGSWALALNLITIGILLFSLGATYALIRRLVGRTDAAVFGAIAFTYSSYSFGHIIHMHLLLLGQFSLGFLLTFRLFRRPRLREGLWLGLLNVTVCAGSLYYALSWALCLGTAVGIWLIAGRVRRGRQFWLAMLTMVAVSLLALPILIPYARLSADRPLIPEWSIKASDAITVAPGSYLYPGLDNRASTRPLRWEHSFFPGFSTAVLALVGIVVLVGARRKRWGDQRGASGDDDDSNSSENRFRRLELWIVLAAAAVNMIIAIGPDIRGHTMPFTWLHSHVNAFAGIRVTARFAVPALLAVSVLAALGYAALARRLRPRTVAVVAVILAAFLVLELAAPITHVRLPEDAPTLAVYRALHRRSPGATAELPMENPAVDGPAWTNVEAVRMLYATLDWHPRVNGQSGGWPDDFIKNVVDINQYPGPVGVAATRRLHVRYLILHTGYTAGFPQYTRAQVREILRRLPSNARARRYGNAWLIDLGHQ